MRSYKSFPTDNVTPFYLYVSKHYKVYDEFFRRKYDKPANNRSFLKWVPSEVILKFEEITPGLSSRFSSYWDQYTLRSLEK